MEVSHDGENFIRVTKLVVDEVAARLRSFFKDKWKLKFPNEQEWDDSPTSGNIFWSKLTNGARDAAAKRREKKKIKNGSTQEWDCTLLCHVLLDSGIFSFLDKKYINGKFLRALALVALKIKEIPTLTEFKRKNKEV